ncbi:hypothetical protein HDU93_000186 [Gonapodya sp. JEL0774]|nr:hypothetical protein HDU93_000186 [Gonapodya sp. JEL0774]
MNLQHFFAQHAPQANLANNNVNYLANPLVSLPSSLAPSPPAVSSMDAWQPTSDNTLTSGQPTLSAFPLNWNGSTQINGTGGASSFSSAVNTAVNGTSTGAPILPNFHSHAAATLQKIRLLDARLKLLPPTSEAKKAEQIRRAQMDPPTYLKTFSLEDATAEEIVAAGALLRRELATIAAQAKVAKRHFPEVQGGTRGYANLGAPGAFETGTNSTGLLTVGSSPSNAASPAASTPSEPTLNGHTPQSTLNALLARHAQAAQAATSGFSSSTVPAIPSGLPGLVTSPVPPGAAPDGKGGAVALIAGAVYVPTISHGAVQQVLDLNSRLLRVLRAYQRRGWTDDPDYLVNQKRLQSNLAYLAAAADWFFAEKGQAGKPSPAQKIPPPSAASAPDLGPVRQTRLIRAGSEAVGLVAVALAEAESAAGRAGQSGIAGVPAQAEIAVRPDKGKGKGKGKLGGGNSSLAASLEAGAAGITSTSSGAPVAATALGGQAQATTQSQQAPTPAAVLQMKMQLHRLMSAKGAAAATGTNLGGGAAAVVAGGAGTGGRQGSSSAVVGAHSPPTMNSFAGMAQAVQAQVQAQAQAQALKAQAQAQAQLRAATTSGINSTSSPFLSSVSGASLPAGLIGALGGEGQGAVGFAELGLPRSTMVTGQTLGQEQPFATSASGDTAGTSMGASFKVADPTLPSNELNFEDIFGFEDDEGDSKQDDGLLSLDDLFGGDGLDGSLNGSSIAPPPMPAKNNSSTVPAGSGPSGRSAAPPTIPTSTAAIYAALPEPHFVADPNTLIPGSHQGPSTYIPVPPFALPDGAPRPPSIAAHEPAFLRGISRELAAERIKERHAEESRGPAGTRAETASARTPNKIELNVEAETEKPPVDGQHFSTEMLIEEDEQATNDFLDGLLDFSAMDDDGMSSWAV